jgi:hypothetical protein
MVDKDLILNKLHQHFDTRLKVSVDDLGLVSCTGSVTLKNTTVEHLPVRFKHVDGYFDCSHNRLLSLEGAPVSVGEWFNCSSNQLATLAGAPQTVGTHFFCHRNKLQSLVGAPSGIPGRMDCIYNPFYSLDGLPQEIGLDLILTYIEKLPLLRCLASKQGVMFLDKNTRVQTGDAQKVAAILNRYAGQGEAGAFACGAELASAGFKENARW